MCKRNFGIYPLKYFFSESMQTDTGEEISTREVKKINERTCRCRRQTKNRWPMRSWLRSWKKKGMSSPGRTVAKYREQLGIPVASSEKRNIKAYETILEYKYPSCFHPLLMVTYGIVWRWCFTFLAIYPFTLWSCWLPEAPLFRQR